MAYEGALLDLKAIIEDVLGVKLPNQDTSYGDFEGQLLGMDLSLGANLLVTDAGINFSDFKYELSTRTGAGYRFNEYARPLQLQITNIMAIMLCYHLGVEVMVTIGAQHLHARYKPEEIRASLEQ